MGDDTTTGLTEAPFFTIILATGDHLDWLEEAVGSVQAQSFPSWELSLAVYREEAIGTIRECLRQWNDPRIRLAGVTEPGNSSRARNLGARDARGHFLAFLDEDDLWHVDHLKFHAEAWSKHPGHGLLFSHLFLFWDDGELEAYIPAHATDEINADFLRRRMTSGFHWPIPGTTTISIRKDVFQKVGGFDIETPVLDDVEIEYHIASRYPVLSLPEVTVARRQHRRGRLTRALEEGYRHSCRVLEEKHQLPADSVGFRSLRMLRHSRLLDWAVAELGGQALPARLVRALKKKDKPSVREPRLYMKWVVMVILGVRRFHRLRVTRSGGRILKNERSYLKQSEPIRMST